MVRISTKVLQKIVMSDSPCARRRYAALILCIHIRHSIIHPHVKFQDNQTNINIIIGIQSSLSLIHWSLFEDEKKESVEIGGAIFHNASRCVETFAPKRDAEQSYEYNT